MPWLQNLLWKIYSIYTTQGKNVHWGNFLTATILSFIVWISWPLLKLKKAILLLRNSYLVTSLDLRNYGGWYYSETACLVTFDILGAFRRAELSTSLLVANGKVCKIIHTYVHLTIQCGQQLFHLLSLFILLPGWPADSLGWCRNWFDLGCVGSGGRCSCGKGIYSHSKMTFFPLNLKNIFWKTYIMLFTFMKELSIKFSLICSNDLCFASLVTLKLCLLSHFH